MAFRQPFVDDGTDAIIDEDVWTHLAFNAYQCGKKLKSIYLETTTFLVMVCPTRVFCSRQIK